MRRAMMAALAALKVLAQEHYRDSLHVYDETLRYGIGCSVCAALMELHDYLTEED